MLLSGDTQESLSVSMILSADLLQSFVIADICCLQYKRLSAAVGFGGGRSQLLEEGSLPRHLLESPQSCVVDVTTSSSQTLLPSSTTEWANSVKNTVQRFASATGKHPHGFWWYTCSGDCRAYPTISVLSPFPLTQKRPSSDRWVWNWVGCHLRFMWQLLQSIQFNLRLR